jgi:hypothetical protein
MKIVIPGGSGQVGTIRARAGPALARRPSAGFQVFLEVDSPPFRTEFDDRGDLPGCRSRRVRATPCVMGRQPRGDV